MSSTPFLLGVHVALALGLTILIGVQGALLGSLGHGDASVPTAPRRARSYLAATLAVPLVTLAVAVTGGMLLRSGSRGGPWVLAGVLSAIVVAASAGWALWLRRRSRAEGWAAPVTLIAAVQWGAPAFAVAAAFLMAWRPESVVGAVIPVVLALVLTGAVASWTVTKTRSSVHVP